MRLKTLLGGTLALLLSSAPSLAQETGSDTTSGGISGQLEASTQLSPKEKLAFSREALTEMQDALRTVDGYLEQAQKEEDPERIQCVRMKQASIKALSDVSERADAAMKEALAAGNEERAEHEFRKIAVALSKVRQFLAEAEACVGQGGVAAGTTSVDVDAGALSDEDPSETEVIDAPIVEVPPEESVFQ